jgi:hypothetical protein
MSGAVKQLERMSLLAGHLAPKEILLNVAKLELEYYARRPDVDDVNQLIHFGTSGHRGSPLRGTLAEAHILAIAQGSATTVSPWEPMDRFRWVREEFEAWMEEDEWAGLDAVPGAFAARGEFGGSKN